MLRQYVRSLLVELKDMPLLGDVPDGRVYYARMWMNGNVSLEAASSKGRGGPASNDIPYSERQDPQTLEAMVGNLSGKYVAELSKAQKKLAKKLVKAGYFTVEKEKVESARTLYNYRKGFRAKYKSYKDIPKTLKRFKTKVGYASTSKIVRVDKTERVIDMNLDYMGTFTRRPAKVRTGRAYVIPSGDVAFDEKLGPLQKMLKYLLGKDPDVTEDFQIVGSEKYRNMSIGDVLGRPDEVAGALTGKTPIVMFHGTSGTLWKKIQKQGLRPGATGESYGDLIPGYSNENVYLALSHAEAENYATRQAINNRSTAVVLRVTVPDYTRLRPDEDQMGYESLDRPYRLHIKREFSIPGTDLEPGQLVQNVHPRSVLDSLHRNVYEDTPELAAFEIAVHNMIASMVKKSIAGSSGGTVAYKGIIRPQYIELSMEYKKQRFDTPESKGGPSRSEYEEHRKHTQHWSRRS